MGYLNGRYMSSSWLPKILRYMSHGQEGQFTIKRQSQRSQVVLYRNEYRKYSVNCIQYTRRLKVKTGSSGPEVRSKVLWPWCILQEAMRDNAFCKRLCRKSWKYGNIEQTPSNWRQMRRKISLKATLHQMNRLESGYNNTDLAQKYLYSTIKTLHNIAKDLTFTLRCRDFL